MEKKLLHLILFILIPLFSFAQKVTVSGLVIDGAMNEPLTGASVVLLQPKDSVQASGVSSDLEGKFKLPAVKAGNYILRISYMGFQTRYRNITLPKGNKTLDLGSITLEENSQMMKEAEVVGKLAQVEQVGDTTVFNADAYRLPEGSALEELVRKLPGAEVDDEGNIKINGKSVSKIMVDGKEYFQNDTKMAMKNLPTNLIKKLKAYDRKSDYSRITGIDDGEEETVIDLSVKKGMKDGWIGNFDAAYGTSDRYTLKGNINRFLDNSFLSIIGSNNNINDGGGRWGGGGNNGITTRTQGGVTFAWENGKPDYSAGLIKVGGNVRYDSSDSESQSRTNSEMYLPSGKSQFSNSKSQSNSFNQNVNANFQLEWFPDSMTNILFRPNFSHSNGDSDSHSHSVTFDENPFTAGMTDPVEQFRSYPNIARVNDNERFNTGNNYSNNVNGELQINRRLVVPGRNLTLNLNGSYSESNNESYTRSMVNYYQRSGSQTATYQDSHSPSKNYSYQGRLSYAEPILHGTFVQLSYQAQYRFQDSNRELFTFDRLAEALQDKGLTDVTAVDLNNGTYNGQSFQSLGIDLTQLALDEQNSQYATYREFNQSVNLMLRHTSKLENGQELRFNAGVNWQPQRTEMDYKKRGIDTLSVRNIQNWAPRFDLRWKISNSSQLRARYNGRMSQPSMTNLIEVTDDSNPLSISTGNAGLKSSWNDNFNFEYNNYITERQMGWNFNGWGNVTRRNISNATVYDEQTGVSYHRPMNIDGGWNTGAWMGFNTAIGPKKYFNFNFNHNINFSNNVGYISSNLDDGARQIIQTEKEYMSGLFSYMDSNNLLQKATTKSKSFGSTIKFNFRNDLMEIGVNSNYNHQIARNDMQSNGNQNTWFFSYGGNVVFNFPWNMQFSSDISQQSRRGYDDATMNTNELIWNAQLSQNFLKQKNATVSLQWNDILAQRSSISRNYSATNRSDTWTNAIHSYVMVHVIYRFNLMGSKDVRRQGFGGGGPGGWGGGGGRGGYGGFGGGGGRF